MWLSDVSVKRPTVAIVFSLLLCVFGYVSFTKLAVREMPDISNPVVTVSTTYVWCILLASWKVKLRPY